MRDAFRRIMPVPLKMAAIGRVPVTNMGLGSDGRELNGDQQDRRPKHPQQCADRSHAQLIPGSEAKEH
jgi:hypothetical protein